MSYNYGVITDENKEQWMKRQRKYLVPLIRRRMLVVEEKESEDIPVYIQQLFNHFCDRKTSINVSCIGEEVRFMDKSLRNILFTESDNGVEEVDVGALTIIFPNIRSMVDSKGKRLEVAEITKK